MKHEMKQFENYLTGQSLTERSRDEHLKNLGYFTNWCKEEAILDKAFLNRSSILAYVEYMQNKPLAISTQNVRLNSLKKYYRFLKDKGIIKRNPVKNLVIRNAMRKVVYHPLGELALIELFDEYVSYLDAKPKYAHLPGRETVNLRRKVITSLVIFQGLHTGELKKLLMSDVNIQASTITIAGGARSNSRILPLHQRQIIPLYEYLREKVASDQQRLFTNKIQKGFYTILDELKVINPMIQNLQHIRASVLMNWIKNHGKRKAQYMIGHRYVSTTQSYEIQDTSELSELMERTHLFG